MANAFQRATGKTYGAGGDYFTPGTHEVRVTEIKLFDSAEDNCEVFVVKSTVLHSVGGQHNWEMANGVAKMSDQPRPARPMRQGADAGWVLKDNGRSSQIFPTRMGNFFTACKQALRNEKLFSLPSAEFAKVVDQNQSLAPDAKAALKDLYKSIQELPDATQGDDLPNMYKTGVCVGLILKVSCSDKGTKDKSKIITNSAWSALDPARVAVLEAAASKIAAGSAPAGDDDDDE